MFYTITLNPAIDYIFNCKQINFNSTNRTIASKNYLISQDGNYQIGGKGISSGLCYLRHAKDCRLIFANATFTKEIINKLLQKLKLNFNQLISFNYLQAIRLNAKIMIDSQMTEINDHNYLTDQSLYQEILKYLNKNLKADDCVSLNGIFPKYIGKNKEKSLFGSTDSEIEKNFSKALAKLVQSKKAKLILDTSKVATLAALPFKPFLIKPNFDELFGYFDLLSSNFKEAKKLADRLIKLGAQNVLLSMGKDGASLFWENNYVKLSTIKNIKQKIVSFQGCGDSMVGAFVFYYQNKCQNELSLKNRIELLKYAMAAGNAKAFQLEIPNKKEVKIFYNLYQDSKNFKIKIVKTNMFT